MLTFLLVTGLFFQGNTPDSTFLIRGEKLKLEPPVHTVLLGENAQDVFFQMNYDGTVTGDMRFRANLIGPGLSSAVSFDVPATDGGITVPETHLTEEGLFSLTDVRLEQNGTLITYAQPRVGQIQVLDKILITNVDVRELGQQELVDMGYIFNEDDYRSVEFTITLVMEASTRDVTVPVVFPRKKTSSFKPVILSDPLRPAAGVRPMYVTWKDEPTPGGFPFPPETTTEGGDGLLSLLVIPGQFSYLKTHFKATCIVLNTAPEEFNVRVLDLKADLSLPSAEKYGFPLTIDENPIQDMLHVGADGEKGTPDDRAWIDPGEEASAQYILTGEIEGVYDVGVKVTGKLDLPSGTVNLTSLGSAKVFVRNPDFNVTIEHPDTVAKDEPYAMQIYVRNKGTVNLEGLSVKLDPDTLIGTVLNGSNPIQTVGTVLPGEEAVVTYQFTSQIAGKVNASYFKLKDDLQGDLQFTVGIGENGERISPTVIRFPRAFDTYVPADLASKLRRYARKLNDFSQMAARDLPAGYPRINNGSAWSLLEDWGMATKARVWGLTDREMMACLLTAFMRSGKDDPAIDITRRLIQMSGSIDLETSFATAMNSIFAGVSNQDMLRILAEESERTPGRILMLFESAGDYNLVVTDGEGRMMATDGSREIPHGGMFDLGSGRILVWMSSQATMPTFGLSSVSGLPITVNADVVFPSQNGSTDFHLSQQGLNVDADLTVQLVGNGQALLRDATGIRETIQGDPMAGKVFSLLAFKQLDPSAFASADEQARDLVMVFSKPVDLSSFLPIEDHLTINGLPAVDGQLLGDGRFVVVSPKMPVGPYRDVTYNLKNVTSRDGQSIGDLTGTVDSSSYYTGVSVDGRVFDHAKANLTGARVFLLQHNLARLEQSGTFGDPITQEELADLQEDHLPKLSVLHEVGLDSEGRYSFDFVPYPAFLSDLLDDPAFQDRNLELLKTFRIGVLLNDGRYEEREFFPQGIGNTLVADMAFNHLGTVEGVIYDSNGAGVPNTTVFVANQKFPDSAAVVQTDATGFYRAENIEVGQVLVKSTDGLIAGLNGGYLTEANSPLRIDVFIDQPLSSVTGVVTFEENGETRPLANTFVGIRSNEVFNYTSSQLSYGINYNFGTRTAADGSYSLPDVLAGPSEIIFYHPDHGMHFRTVTLVEGVPAVQDHVYYGLIERGSVAGRIVDTNGFAVPNAYVSIQYDGHTYRVLADGAGNYQFTNMPLNIRLQLHASADPLKGRAVVFLDSGNPDITNMDITIKPPILVNGRVLDENGAPVPFVELYRPMIIQPVARTNEDGHFSELVHEPGEYNYAALNPPHLAHGRIYVPEEGVNDFLLRERPQSELVIKVVDSSGNPVVSHVKLESEVPSTTVTTKGLPIPYVHDRITDTTGTYHFKKINTGVVTVWGSSKILGETERYTFNLEELGAGESPKEITLAFFEDETANLFGQVFDVDGISPAPAGTQVQVVINGVNATATVNEHGMYRFESLLQTGTPQQVQVTAVNPANGLFAECGMQLHQDLRFRHDLVLKTKGSVQVAVQHADGSEVDGAAVKIGYNVLTFDHENQKWIYGPFTQQANTTPADPVVSFIDVPAGPITLTAIGPNGLVAKRSYVLPNDGQALDVTLSLEASSSIDGTFVDDFDAPILNAEVQLRRGEDLLQQILSGSDPGLEGTFGFDNLPMREYVLVGTDPATNRQARAEVFTSPYYPSVTVQLKLDPVGHLEGIVYDDGVPVVNATVMLESEEVEWVTGTDTTGKYQFRNLPLGEYRVVAFSRASPQRSDTLVTLTDSGVVHQRDLNYARSLSLQVNISFPDNTPASRVFVRLIPDNRDNFFGDTNITTTDGVVHFPNVIEGRYKIHAQDPRTETDLVEPFTISAADPNNLVLDLSFRGYGTVFGTVLDTQGNTLGEQRIVNVQYWGDLGYTVKSATTDNQGNFRIIRVPIDFKLNISSYDAVTRQYLKTTETLDVHGSEEEVNLVYKSTTQAMGVVEYSDGTPAAFAEVYTRDPVVRTRADANGNFVIEPVVEGDVTLYAEDTNSPRVAAQTFSLVLDQNNLLQPVSGLTLSLGGLGSVDGVVTLADTTLVRAGKMKLTHVTDGTVHITALFGDGSFLLQNIPLGDYNLVAYDNKLEKETDPVAVSLTTDGVTVTANVVFPPAFDLHGRLYAANGIDPVPGGSLELWREVSNGKFERIYATEANDQGFFVFENVYPDIYRLEGSDPLLNAFNSVDVVMPSSDLQHDLTLVTRSWLLGNVQTPSGTLFGSGFVRVLQGTRERVSQIAADGTFRVDDLIPGPYTATATVAGGWLAASSTGLVGTGTNTLLFQTGETVQLTGQAILITDTTSRASVYLIANGIRRRLSNVDNSGIFLNDEVPAGVPISLELEGRSASRRFDLGSFASDTALGTFYIDSFKPSLVFPDDGMNVTALPFSINFDIAEDDIDSNIDPNSLFMTINGTRVADEFTVTQTSISATYNLFAPYMERGENNIYLEIRNTSGVKAWGYFTFNISQNGTMLLVDMVHNSIPAPGSARLDDGAPVASDSNGRVVFNGVTAGSHQLRGFETDFGKRAVIDVQDELAQFVTLQLAEHGEYRGIVTDNAGNPATGVLVDINGFTTMTAADGSYSMDYLPAQINDHDATVDAYPYFGYRDLPMISSNKLVILNQDFQLMGRGTVSGFIYDGDGVSPVEGATVNLDYDDLPHAYNPVVITSDANGAYTFTDVLTTSFKVLADLPGQYRGGSTTAEIVNHGDSVTVNVDLEPTATITGIVVDDAGNPVEGAEILFQRRGTGGVDFSTTSAADGSFSVSGLPQGPFFDLRFTHISSDLFYKSDRWSFSQPTRDIGSKTMVANQPPELVVWDFPEYWDPALDLNYRYTISDDYLLDSITLTFSGIHSQVYSLTDIDYHLKSIDTDFDLPNNVAEGVMHYRWDIVDKLGVTTVIEGDIQVSYDAQGPLLTLTNPVDGASVTAGDPLAITVDASDPNGVNRVEFWVDGTLWATDTTSPYAFDVNVPAVETAGPVVLNIRGVDGLGLQSDLPLTLNVTPLITTGNPVATFRWPLQDMPLPLDISPALSIPISLDLEDADGVDRAVVTVAGEIIVDARVFGQSYRLDIPYTISPVLQQAQTIDFTVDLYDLGGNQSTETITVRWVTGNVFTADTTIEPFNTVYDNQTVIFDGGTHIVDGKHTFDNLILLRGAVLTQTATATNQSYVALTDVTATDSIVIAPGTTVNMDDKGFDQVPNALQVNDGSTSHAGFAAGESDTAHLYGSPFEPYLPGTYAGGGAVKFTANGMYVAGVVSASNLDSRSYFQPYDGSGGSVWLNATNMHGFGLVRANAFTDLGPANFIGGGGRVAIYGDFKGTVEALGGDEAGAGTIYLRKPDAGQADGYYDELRIETRPDEINANSTVITVLENLVVGTDVLTETRIIDNQSYDILTIVNPSVVPYAAFLGMRPYRTGEYDLSQPIGVQTDFELRSQPGGSFPAFANGDVIHIGYKVDKIVVGSNAAFDLNGAYPLASIDVDGAILRNSANQMDFTALTVNAVNQTLIDGSFHLGDYTSPISDAPRLRGDMGAGSFTVPAGADQTMSGILTANALGVESGAVLHTEEGVKDISLKLDATVMTIAGTVRAIENGAQEVNDYFASNGGMGSNYDFVETRGSLYRPLSQGSAHLSSLSAPFAGGLIHLVFDSLDLSGTVHTESENQNSGGSILLEGTTLTGAGTISANADQTTESQHTGGGGRIGVLVDNIDLFSGTATAFGGHKPNADSYDGAGGTVFYRTTTYPNGHLVVDNNDNSVFAYVKTLLPGLGSRTAGSATGGASISGTDFPDSLEGLYVFVDGHDPVRIASNTDTELFPENGFSFPTLQAGDTYIGLHILDILELRGGSTVETADKVQIMEDLIAIDGQILSDELILPGAGQTQTYTDGTLTLNEDPGFASLELNNFVLTVNYPLNIETLTLTNGAKLIYTQPVTAQNVTVDGSTLEDHVLGSTIALNAQSLSLSNGSLWTVGDRPQHSDYYPLRTSIAGDFLLDATSSISTGGSLKGPAPHFAWAGDSFETDSHGGYSRLEFQNGQNLDTPLMGSFRYPDNPGSAGGGGAMYLQVGGNFQLDGSLAAEGSSGSGGSIWIDAGSVTGAGSLSVKGANYSKGNGRIAVHHQGSEAFRDTLDFQITNNVSDKYDTQANGAGTLFIKGPSNTHGDIVINQKMGELSNQDRNERRQRLTGVTGLKVATLVLNDDDPSATVIRDLSWQDLPPGLAGLYVRFHSGGSDYESLITGNTHNALILATPVLDTLPAGTELSFVLKLDNLTLKDGAQFYFAGLLEVANLDLQGSYLNSVYVDDLVGLPNPLVLNSNLKLRLILEQTNLSTYDLQLDNASVYFDKPVTVNNITLTNGATIEHSPNHVNAGGSFPHFYPYVIFEPSLNLTANTITADSTSGIEGPDASHWEWSSSGNAYASSHSFGSSAVGDIYGSIYEPDHHGSGGKAGGRLHVIANTINGGFFRANGNVSSGGSVWVEAGIITGNVHLEASGLNGSGGAGRVALHYDDITGATITTSTYGLGGPGTVYLKDNGQAYGLLRIDDGIATTGDRYTPFPGFIHTLGASVSATFDAANNRTTLTMPDLTVDVTKQKDRYKNYLLVVDGDHFTAPRILDRDTDQVSVTLWLEGDHAAKFIPGATVQVGIRVDSIELCNDCYLVTDRGKVYDAEDFDQTPPVIDSITVAPLHTGDLRTGETITVGVAASDNFQVAQAIATLDGVIQTIDSPPPYSFSFDPLVNGNVNVDLTITITDGNGNQAMSTNTYFVESSGSADPVVSYISPLAGANIASESAFTTELTVIDDGSMDRLEVTFNGVTQTFNYSGGDPAQTVPFNWTAPFTATSAPMDITAVGFDTLGNSGTTILPIVVGGSPLNQSMPMPVSYWSFDNVTVNGNDIADLIHANPATNMGALGGQVGQVGQAFQFDQDIISVPDSDSLDFTTAYSISVWIKPDQNFPADGMIVTKEFDSTNTNYFQRYALWRRSSNTKTIASRFNRSTNSYYTAYGSTKAENDVWTHVVGTFDGTNIRIYINGVLDKTTSAPYEVGKSDQSLNIGGHLLSNSRYFFGLIDELAVWNVALDASQIDLIYQTGLAGAGLGFTPPEPPTDWSLVPQSNGIDVTWTASPDSEGQLVGYRIFVDGTPTDLSASTLSYTITGLASDQFVDVELVAFDAEDNTSGPLKARLATLASQGEIQPVSYYNMDTASVVGGTVCEDVMDQNDGTIYGPAINQEGVLGEGFLFDRHSRVEIPYHPSLDMPGTKITMAAWIKIADSFSHYGYIFQRPRSTSTSDSTSNYGLRIQSTDRIRAVFHDGSSERYVDQDNAIYPGQWHHVVAVYDGTNYSIYLDGFLLKEQALAYSLVSNTFGLAIGNHYYDHDNGFAGFVDEVAIWDEALSPAAVNNLHRKTVNGQPVSTAPPAPPASWSVIAGANSLDIAWVPSTTVAPPLAGYRLTIDGTVIDLPISANNYQVTGLSPEQFVDLTLVAVDDLGVTSAPLFGIAATLPASGFPQPTSYWGMDDAQINAGSLLDVMGINDGTIQGATTGQLGVVGQAFLFDRYSLVSIPYNPSLDMPGTQLTISVWAKVPASFSHYGYLVHRARTTSPGDSYTNYGMRVNSTNTMTFLFNQGSYDRIVGATGAVSPGGWVHYVGVYDGAYLKIYQDGVLIKQQAQTDSIASNEMGLALGNHLYDNDNGFAGYLDEIAIWNQALPPAAVNAVYFKGLNGQPVASAPPEPPASWTPVAEANAIQIDWTLSSSPQVTGYRLTIDGVATDVSPSTTTHRFESLTPEQFYAIELTAFDADGMLSAPYVATVATEPTAGLPQSVSYWPFDNATINGTQVQDAMGRNHGESEGVVTGQPGRVGESILFDRNAKISIPYHPSLNMGGTQVSMTAWIKQSTTGSGYNAIIARPNTTSTSSQESIYGLTTGYANSSLLMRAYGTSSSIATFNNALETDQWMHVAGVYDGVNLSIYLDAVLVYQKAFAQTLASNDLGLALGNLLFDDDNGFHGLLDEIALYDMALTAGMVNNIYHKGLNGFPISNAAPAQPASWTVIPESNAIDVSWTASPAPNLAGYRLTVDGVSTDLPAIAISHRIEGLAPETFVDLVLVAVDTDGLVSAELYTTVSTEPTAGLPQPVSFWSFDNATISGTQVQDLMGTNHGQSEGVTTGEPGRVGESILFDRYAKISVPYHPSLDMGGTQVSMIAWVKHAAGTGYNAIIARPNSTSTSSQDSIYGLSTGYSSNSLWMRGYGTSGSTAIFNNALELNTWMHVAGVYDGTNLNIYLDGFLVYQKAFTQTLDSNELGLALGNLLYDDDNGFHGHLDEIALYDSALTAAMVNNIYRKGINGLAVSNPAPAAPASWAVIPGSDSLNVSWSASPASNLAAYRLTVDGVSIDFPTTTLSHTVSGLSSEQFVDLSLVAVDSEGLVSRALFATIATEPTSGTTPPDSYWSMDDSSVNGAEVQDQVGTNHGTSSGVTTGQTGVSGEAILFDRYAKISVPYDASLDFGSTEVSLVTWVKQPTPAVGNNVMIARPSSTSTSSTQSVYGLYTGYNQNHAVMNIYTTSNHLETANNVIPPDTWVHVAGVYDGASILVYIDGFLVDQKAQTGTLATNTLGLAIGNYLYDDDNGFHGTIDEVAIYGSALSAAEINNIYRKGVNGLPIVAPASKQETTVGLQSAPDMVDDDGLVLPLPDEASNEWVWTDRKVSVDSLEYPGTLILDGTTLQVAGDLSVGNLILRDGAVITVPMQSASTWRALNLWATGSIDVDGTSRINLDGLGLTAGEAWAHASHGGLATDGSPDQRYDSPVYPALPGSAPSPEDGASVDEKLAIGGGAVLVQAQHLHLDGVISAKGRRYAAGGAVQLFLTEWTGRGSVDVSGGKTTGAAGAVLQAGGGRVAVHGSDLWRFNGRIITGYGQQDRGSVLIAEPGKDWVVLGDRWPFPDNELMRVPLLPAMTLNPAQITDILTNRIGAVLTLESEKDLTSYHGLWLQHGEDRFRVLSVIRADEDRYYLQLDKQEIDLFEAAEFILLTANPEQLEPSPVKELPVVPKQ